MEGLLGITTGLPELDEITFGWCPKDLIILFAASSNGKSFWALFFALMAWKSGKKVMFLTLELDKIVMSYRLDTLYRNFKNSELMQGRLNNKEDYIEYLESLKNSETPFWLLSEENNGNKRFNVSDIDNLIQDLKPDIVIIDQASFIDDIEGSRDIRQKYINISNGIKNLAKKHDIPIMVLHQALLKEVLKEQRKKEGYTPENDELQESSNPIQDADTVISLSKYENIFYLYVAKNRKYIDKDKFIYEWDLDNGIMRSLSEEELVF